MQVLVTGGAGFIGAHVVDALVGDGHHVRVLDALSDAATPRDRRTCATRSTTSRRI